MEFAEFFGGFGVRITSLIVDPGAVVDLSYCRLHIRVLSSFCRFNAGIIPSSVRELSRARFIFGLAALSSPFASCARSARASSIFAVSAFNSAARDRFEL